MPCGCQEDKLKVQQHLAKVQYQRQRARELRERPQPEPQKPLRQQSQS